MPSAPKPFGQEWKKPMELTSRKKGFPVIAVMAILTGGLFVALGINELDEDDPIKPWGSILMGVCLVIGWTGNLLNQIVEIVVDDQVIRYRRRNGSDIVIQRADVIDSEVRPARIRFRYKGPFDVQSASIPLRRFVDGDTLRLREIFGNEGAAQQAGSYDGGKLSN